MENDFIPFAGWLVAQVVSDRMMRGIYHLIAIRAGDYDFRANLGYADLQAILTNRLDIESERLCVHHAPGTESLDPFSFFIYTGSCAGAARR
jgi:hypothetical protein